MPVGQIDFEAVDTESIFVWTESVIIVFNVTVESWGCVFISASRSIFLNLNLPIVKGGSTDSISRSRITSKHVYNVYGSLLELTSLKK